VAKTVAKAFELVVNVKVEKLSIRDKLVSIECVRVVRLIAGSVQISSF
jgi:hypothetical protein